MSLGKSWRLYFVNGLRADIMTRELVDLMVDAGTVWVTYAVESGNARIQQLIKKNMRLERAADIINYSQDRGMSGVNVNTMYGFPTETAAEAQETLEYLAQLRMPSLLPYHFCLRGYEGCEIVEQAEEAGWDTSAFLADGTSSYHEIPMGTMTFPRGEMLDHVLEYHKRFGMHNKPHLSRSLDTLRQNGYTDRDLVDMYSVLQNRPFRRVEDIVARLCDYRRSLGLAGELFGMHKPIKYFERALSIAADGAWQLYRLANKAIPENPSLHRTGPTNRC